MVERCCHYRYEDVGGFEFVHRDGKVYVKDPGPVDPVGEGTVIAEARFYTSETCPVCKGGPCPECGGDHASRR